MVRITVDVPDADLPLIDADAKQKKISRSKWAAIAIDAYLHQKYITDDAEMHQLEEKVMQLQKQLSAKDNEIDKLNQDLNQSKIDADAMQEVHQFKDLLDAKDQELIALKSEEEKKWRETSQLRSEVTQAKRELESSRSKIDHLQSELDKKRIESEQVRIEAETLRRDQGHYKSTIEMKDKQIGFLEGHVAQLTQSISQLSLKPGEEEIKKKGWWQFWK
jgi:chromosome segregation ATPase